MSCNVWYYKKRCLVDNNVVCNVNTWLKSACKCEVTQSARLQGLQNRTLIKRSEWCSVIAAQGVI